MKRPHEHHGDAPGRKPRPFLYNPLEIAFPGVPGAGRSALVANLASRLAGEFDVGIAVAEASDRPLSGIAQAGFGDYPGIDGGWILEAGALQVHVRRGELDPGHRSALLLDHDLVLIDGPGGPETPSFPFIESGDSTAGKSSGTGEDDPPSGRIQACITTDPGLAGKPAPSGNGAEGGDPVPCFHVDDMEGILGRLRGTLALRIAERPLHGLVLTGGGSTRMGSDKARLMYHGMPQAEFACLLLGDFCREVYISSRSEQAETDSRRGRRQIHDVFLGFGPVGGILSAMLHEPEAAWLVLGCDLPFVDDRSLRALVERRRPARYATAFRSTFDGFPEPLCTIYEPKSRLRMLQYLALGNYCPRKTLFNSPIQLLEPLDENALANVNRPEEYEAARARLGIDT